MSVDLSKGFSESFGLGFKRYVVEYDHARQSIGVWDRQEAVFVAHTGTEAGSRVVARRMNYGVAYGES